MSLLESAAGSGKTGIPDEEQETAPLKAACLAFEGAVFCFWGTVSGGESGLRIRIQTFFCFCNRLAYGSWARLLNFDAGLILAPFSGERALGAGWRTGKPCRPARKGFCLPEGTAQAAAARGWNARRALP